MTGTRMFQALADEIGRTMQPPARAAATAATLRQIAVIPAVAESTIYCADAGAGYCSLAQRRDDDTPAVTARRATCKELSEAAYRVAEARVAAGEWDRVQNADRTEEALAVVLAAVAGHFAGSVDPRQAAIASTSAREAGELLGAIQEHATARAEDRARAREGLREWEERVGATQRPIDPDPWHD